MESKTARLTLLIDPNKKAAFERLCARQDRTASQVVRQLIRDYLAHHGVLYEAGGTAQDDPVAPRTAATPAAKVRGRAQSAARGRMNAGAVRRKR